MNESRFGSRTLGSLQLADIGCQIFSDPAKLADTSGNGLGGILVAIEDSAAAGDTGEIRRAFKLWDRYAPADDSQPNTYPRRQGTYLIIPETVCGQDSVGRFDSHAAVKATFQMLSEYCRRRGPQGSRLLVGYDVDLVRNALNLIHAVLGGAS